MSHSIVVQFAPDLLGRPGAALPEAGTLDQLGARAARGLLIAGESRRRIASRLPVMRRLPAWPRLVTLLEILGELAAAPVGDVHLLASAGFAPVLDPGDGPRISAACRYVSEGFTDVILQPQAARLAGLSSSAFSRYFRRRMGMTFAAYVNEVRVGHACRFLQEIDRTISEIAFAVGYNNLANFNRRFRAITSLTPTQFRRGHVPQGTATALSERKLTTAGARSPTALPPRRVAKRRVEHADISDH